jgi:hypothetical protein
MCSTSLTLSSLPCVKGLTRKCYVCNKKDYKLGLTLVNFEDGTKPTNYNSSCAIWVRPTSELLHIFNELRCYINSSPLLRADALGNSPHTQQNSKTTPGTPLHGQEPWHINRFWMRCVPRSHTIMKKTLVEFNRILYHPYFTFFLFFANIFHFFYM